jgi:aminopeptidase N
LQIFFNQWFLSKGHPIVDMNYRYDSLNKQCVFEFRQKHSALPGRTFRLPVQLEFYFFDSSTARTVVLDREVQEFRFDFPRPVWTGHNLGRILLCEYNDGRTFDEFVQQFKGSPFYYDRKRALEALVQNPQRFWGAWTDPARTTDAVAYQDLIARAFRDPSPVIRGIVADAIPASLLKQDVLLYGLLVRTAEKDIRSQVRQKALLKLIETADSGKALPAGWLEQKIATDSSLLVTAAALRPIAKTNPNQAEEIAKALENENSMVGTLFGFYADFGQEKSLQYLEKSLMQLRDSRSLRQYPTWLKDYNRAILRLSQKERGLTFYEKLKLHPSARIRTLAAENLSGLR